jgi:hypothetical protein
LETQIHHDDYFIPTIEEKHKNQLEKNTMKALLIYQDLASAAKANTALLHSAQNLDFAVQWTIRPWRVDMLKFPPTAEEALTDAADAHLIVFVGRCAQSFPFWLEHWLEHWAKCRQIEDAALAVFCEGSGDAPSISATLELSQFATRHGLNFICDDKMESASSSTADRSSFTEGSLHEHTLSVSPITAQTLDTKTRDAYRGWSIFPKLQ